MAMVHCMKSERPLAFRFGYTCSYFKTLLRRGKQSQLKLHVKINRFKGKTGSHCMIPDFMVFLCVCCK